MLIAYNGYDSGLGNRVRVVLGCKSLADLEGRRFAYVWPTGRLFGPRLSDLWDFQAPVVSRATSRSLAKLFPYVDESLTWLDDAKRHQRVWQIRTGSPINLPPEAPSWQDEFRSLTPASEIRERVSRMFDEQLRGRPYVGVMIRANAVSHAKTRETSPVEWFIDRMRALRAQDPDLRFFVSCDVPDVQARVVAEIPGCYAQAEKGGYNTVEGVRSAICDLYLLASSGYLLGPHWSSFIHLAEYLSGDVLHLETAVTGVPTSVDYRGIGLVEDPLRPFLRSAITSGAAETSPDTLPPCR